MAAPAVTGSHAVSTAGAAMLHDSLASTDHDIRRRWPALHASIAVEQRLRPSAGRAAVAAVGQGVRRADAQKNASAGR